MEDHVLDLLPGYALGSLDDEELLQVARHLPHCAVCRGDLSTYWDTVDLIAFSLPLQTPPAGLREKIMRRVERPQPVVRAIGSSQTAAEPARRSSLGDFFRRLAARPSSLAFGFAALALVLVLLVSNLALWQQVNGLQAHNQGLSQRVAVLQANAQQGNMQIVRLSGTDHAPQAVGYLMVFKNDTYGTLVVENAPVLDTGKQYQLWLIREGKRSNGGVFSVNEEGYATLQVAADQALDQYTGFGVTIEPSGGSPGPTGNKVLGGSL